MGNSVLMDLTKDFDTINYDLLLTKLRAYEFTNKSLILIKRYLANCCQRTKVNANSNSRSTSGICIGTITFQDLLNY